MQKWEYVAERIDLGSGLTMTRLDLNECGKAGWELVTMIAYQGGLTGTAIFKRPLEETPAPDAPTCGVTDCAQGFGMPCEVCAPDMDTKGDSDNG